MPRVVLAAALAALLVSSTALARGGSHSGSSHHGGAHTASHSSMHASASHSRSSTRSASHSSQGRAYAGVKRDTHGKIARDSHAKEAFQRTHPCPSTGKKYGACPGYVVDHVRALKHGGADDPSNMQWQTRAAAKAKDRWE